MSHDDADPDDDGLKGLRSMWLSLPDEEPPARGLDALMAAARVKAEEMAQPTLWERFVAMLRRPQVLALATIMILIGGAVFISQRRDKLEATQTASTASEQASPELARDQAPAAQTVTAPTGSVNRAPANEGATESVSAGSAMVGGTAGADKGDFMERDERGAVMEPPADPVAAPQKSRAKKSAPGVKTPSPTPKLEQQTKSGRAAGGVTSSSLALDDFEDSSKASGEAKAAVQEPTVKQLHTQARAAAARNDCATVKALAKKIAAKDAPYYRANIAPDASLATCLN